MESLQPAEYDSVDIEVTSKGDYSEETTSSKLQHNGAMGLRMEHVESELRRGTPSRQQLWQTSY
jgi:hypothetical protein